VPLRRGDDRETISHNVATLVDEGRPQRPAVAIALRTARETGDDMEKPKKATETRGSLAAKIDEKDAAIDGFDATIKAEQKVIDDAKKRIATAKKDKGKAERERKALRARLRKLA